jgi:NAD-dependent deacetylase
MQKKKILIFSGAGVSQESGVETFRGLSGGLWNNYDVMKVAHIDAWKEDPQTVIDFYNLRRQDMGKVFPNEAHKIIAELEKWFDVTVVTQNIDNLHELAGSSKVIHLHGEITKLRSEKNSLITQEWIGELELGQLAEDGNQLRPDIVWFGEELDSDRIEEAKRSAGGCDACIIVGTSMQVAPANMIPFLTPETCLLYYVDPGDRDFYVPTFRDFFFYHFQEVASVGMKQVKEDLLSTFKIKE